MAVFDSHGLDCDVICPTNSETYVRLASLRLTYFTPLIDRVHAPSEEREKIVCRDFSKLVPT